MFLFDNAPGRTGRRQKVPSVLSYKQFFTPEEKTRPSNVLNDHSSKIK